MLSLIRFSFLAFLLGSISAFPTISVANSLPVVQVTRQAGVYPSPDRQCEASLKVSEMGGFLTLSITRKKDKRGLNTIKDITGLTWLVENQLLYTVSPIYGEPGVFLFNCTSMRTKEVLRPRTINKTYPYGADYFELQSAMPGAKGMIHFYYAPDVDAVDFKKFRTEDSLYQVNLDGTGFRKVHQ